MDDPAAFDALLTRLGMDGARLSAHLRAVLGG